MKAVSLWFGLPVLALAVQNSQVVGPFVGADTMTWQRNVQLTTVGTAVVLIDEAKHKTITTTSYHTDYVRDGKLEIFTPPTATNSAKYKTAVVGNVTLTYPTNYLSVNPSFTWNIVTAVSKTSTYTKVDTSHPIGRIIQNVASLPKAGTCCITTATGVATSAHSAFKANVQTTDEADKFGWFYELAHPGTKVFEYLAFGPTEVSSMWKPTTLGLSYSGCAYELCSTDERSYPTMAMSAVMSTSGFVVTQTSYISSEDASPSPSPSMTPSPLPAPMPSVEPSRDIAKAPPEISSTPTMPSVAPVPPPVTTASTATPTLPISTPTQVLPPAPAPVVSEKPPDSPDSTASVETSRTPSASSPENPPGANSLIPSPNSPRPVTIQTSDIPPVANNPTPPSNVPQPSIVQTSNSLPTASPPPTPSTTRAAQIPLPAVQMFSFTMMISSMTITEVLRPAYIVSGQTLTMGTQITISPSGTTTVIALSTGSDSQLVLVMNAEHLSGQEAKAEASSVASSTGLGGFIQQGLGG